MKSNEHERTIRKPVTGRVLSAGAGLQASGKMYDTWRTNIYVSKVGRLLWHLVHYVVVFGICFIIVQPIIQKISTGLMSYDDILDISVIYIPKNINTSFFTLTFQELDYWNTLRDTVILCTLVASLQVFASSLVGYGFARFKFPGRSIWFGLMILTMIVPQIVILIPQYLTFKTFDFFGLITLFKPGGVNLLGTFWPYILTSLTVMGYKQGLYVYMLRQFYRGIPRELEEAAYIDGCSKVGTYARIIIPGAKVMLITCFLFAFVWTWTDSFYLTYYMPPLVPFGKKLVTTVPEVVYVIMAELGYNDDYIVVIPPFGYNVAVGNVAVLLTIAPLVLAYGFLQRYFVESIEQTGLK